MYVGSRLGRAQNSKISDDPRRVVLFPGLEELVRDLVLRIGRQSGAAFPAALCSKGVRLLVAMGSLIVGLATQARAVRGNRNARLRTTSYACGRVDTYIVQPRRSPGGVYCTANRGRCAPGL